jgi:hypothetical protein
MDHWPVHLHRRAFAAHVVCAGFGASLPLWPPGRFAIYRHVKANYLNDGPRNYLEFVIHQGESFRRWLQIETHAESRFAGFDPFSGLPVEWNKHRPADHFNGDGQIPVVNDTQARFMPGCFSKRCEVF